MRRCACVVGARPNFVKMAPILRALRVYPDIETVLIHTGQHYDASLSDVFFQELQLPEPDHHLGVGSGSHATQTGRVMERFEELVLAEANAGRPFDLVVVVGDVNSTLACTIVAAKASVPVAHVEAGLRSWDRTMPEEINRLATDALASILFASEPDAVGNLRREGHPVANIHLVGNVMIDSLRRYLPQALQRPVLSQFGVEPRWFAFMTLHRPSNVDAPARLERLLSTVAGLSRELPVLFPVHPRTAARLAKIPGLSARLTASPKFIMVPPLGYLDCLCASAQARMIFTDSGGLQEESTALGVPCLTLRKNTERPITVELGTSTLVGHDDELLRATFRSVLDGTYKKATCPEWWDGHAAERIAAQLGHAIRTRQAVDSILARAA